MCLCVGMCIMICIIQGEHSEPHGTTLAVNYILPFNSSTPKIDGYYNSSIFVKNNKKRKEKKNNSASISQMRRLSSGWDQARKSTLTTAKSWTLESAEVTVHTAYSQHCHREKQNKESHFKHSPVSEDWHYTFRIFIYTIHKWYRTGLTLNARKVLVLFLVTARCDNYKRKRMGTFIHCDRYFHHPPPPPVWQLVGNDNQDYRPSQKQLGHKMYTVSPDSVSFLWKIPYDLLVNQDN